VGETVDACPKCARLAECEWQAIATAGDAPIQVVRRAFDPMKFERGMA
jgi:hypothetical protein